VRPAASCRAQASRTSGPCAPSPCGAAGRGAPCPESRPDHAPRLTAPSSRPCKHVAPRRLAPRRAPAWLAPSGPPRQLAPSRATPLPSWLAPPPPLALVLGFHVLCFLFECPKLGENIWEVRSLPSFHQFGLISFIFLSFHQFGLISFIF
jgi:hypothetical protein